MVLLKKMPFKFLARSAEELYICKLDYGAEKKLG